MQILRLVTSFARQCKFSVFRAYHIQWQCGCDAYNWITIFHDDCCTSSVCTSFLVPAMMQMHFSCVVVFYRTNDWLKYCYLPWCCLSFMEVLWYIDTVFLRAPATKMLDKSTYCSTGKFRDRKFSRIWPIGNDAACPLWKCYDISIRSEFLLHCFLRAPATKMLDKSTYCRTG